MLLGFVIGVVFTVAAIAAVLCWAYKTSAPPNFLPW